MQRQHLLKNIREVLAKAGFYISEIYSTHLTGFDIIARRDEMLLIIKVLTNVDSLSENVANELMKLSSLLRGSPLLIGEKNGSGSLEDDVVYFRFGIYTITFSTLKNYLLEGIPVTIYAAPGGLYANLDQEKLQQLRKEKNISLGTFARNVKISRKTVQMYEEGMNAKVEVAIKIEELLESPITSPIDLFRISKSDTKKSQTYEDGVRNIKEFQREIFSLLENVGYRIFPMNRCPFEALSKEKEKIILTSVQESNRKLIQKAQIMSSISKITEKYAVVFTDKTSLKTNVEGTPLIYRKELKKLRHPEEVFELIIERT